MKENKPKKTQSNLVFEEVSHTYYLDDKKLPSVTEILDKEGFYSSLSNIPDKILQASSKFGNAVHRACELWDKKKLNNDSLSEPLHPYLDAWKKFLVEYKVTSIDGIELQVYSQKWRFAGTLDRIVNKNILLDIKTSTTVSPVTALQLALYKIAYEEMTKNKIKKRLCVQLQPGNYKIYEYQDKMDEFIALGAVNCYKWKEKNLWK